MKKSSKRRAAAFGYFDGLHLGHAAVLDRLCELGKNAVILVESEGEVLLTDGEKRLLLSERGITEALTVSESEYSRLTSKQFLKEYVAETLHADIVVAGENCSLGRDGAGAFELQRLCDDIGLDLVLVPTVKTGGEAVSSDRIKTAFREGDFEAAIKLLGAPYLMMGTIVHGKGLGNKHGMPTANLMPAQGKLLPLSGVYATASRFGDEIFDSLTSVGTRPSVDEERRVSIETYILDFDRDVYGETELLYFKEFVRPNVKFDGGIEAVSEQIARDLDKVYPARGKI